MKTLSAAAEWIGIGIAVCCALTIAITVVGVIGIFGDDPVQDLSIARYFEPSGN